MTHLLNVVSININCIKSKIKQTLLNDFTIRNGLDVNFVQELNTEIFNTLPNFELITNVGSSERGTGVIYRKGINIVGLNCSSDSRIIAAEI